MAWIAVEANRKQRIRTMHTLGACFGLRIGVKI